MKHPVQCFHRLTARLAFLIMQAQDSAQARTSRDRGSNVAETIIIVGGFAMLAFAIYTAVSGKVQTWIAKIP